MVRSGDRSRLLLQSASHWKRGMPRGRARRFRDRPGTQQTRRNICEREWHNLKNAGYLFLWLQRSVPLGALCRQMISELRLFFLC